MEVSHDKVAAGAAARAAKLDAEILKLRAAKMSSFSIAMLMGKGEAWVYNRLAKLDAAAAAAAQVGVQSVAEVEAAAALPPVMPVTPAPKPLDRPVAPRAFMTAVREPAEPGPTVLTRRATVAPAPAPRALPSPIAPKPSQAAGGAFRIKPVSPRIARWAGHFRRARWPLAEVADLFDVDEDDLARALSEARAA